MNLSRLAAFVLALGVAACTGEASFELPSVDAGAPSPRYKAVCAAWARRECAYEEPCTVGFYVTWEDDAQCVERETLACELQADDPDVSFDPARVEGCSFPPNCLGAIGTTSAPESASLCLPPGKGRAGAACVWNSACQSGQCVYAYDLVGSKSACGTCQPIVTCACGPGQLCGGIVDGGAECLTLRDAGEKCGTPLVVCNASECIPSAGGRDGTCKTVPEAGIGMPCSSDLAGPQCVSTTAAAYCDHTSHCRVYRPAAYGDACTLSTGGEGNICEGAGWCDSTNTGICQPPVPDGEPCDGDILPCLPPARCLAGECVFPTLATCD